VQNGNRMFTEPELSPDLEWMLLSGQASDDRIVAALVPEYFGAVYRLALSLLNDGEAARWAAVDVLATALANAHRFSGEDSLQAWLCGLTLNQCSRQSLPANKDKRAQDQAAWLSPARQALPYPQDVDEAKLWRALDALEQVDRLPLVLQSAQQLSGDQLARLFKTSPASLQARLARAQQRLVQRLYGMSVSSGRLREENLKDWLRAALERRWPAAGLSVQEVELLGAEIKARVALKRKSRWLSTRLQELVLVGMAILLVLVFLGAVYANGGS
jgi:DNA-directed RNA polymerase specialized sigma24 family protein